MTSWLHLAFHSFVYRRIDQASEEAERLMEAVGCLLKAMTSLRRLNIKMSIITRGEY